MRQLLQVGVSLQEFILLRDAAIAEIAAPHHVSVAHDTYSCAQAERAHGQDHGDCNLNLMQSKKKSILDVK